MGLTVLPLLALAAMFLCGVDSYNRYRHRQPPQSVIQLEPWRRVPRHTESVIDFSFDKRGFLGRVSFEVDVLLPQESAGRKIAHVNVDFEKPVDAEVTVTKGGLGYNYATIHFESKEDRGDMRAFITLESE